MASTSILNSTNIDSNIATIPILPLTGYWDKDNSIGPATSLDTLNSNIKASCTVTSNNGSTSLWTDSGVQGVYDTVPIVGSITTSDSSGATNIPSDTPSLEIPYQLALNGLLQDSTNGLLYKLTGKNTPPAGKSLDGSATVQQVYNQIEYLTCQLVQSRNREYSASALMSTFLPSINNFKGDAYKSFYPVFAVIFLVTIYILVNGMTSSLDIAYNVFSIIEKSTNNNVSYWIGLLLGMITPIVIVFIIYYTTTKKDIANNKYDITKKPTGDDTTSNVSTNIDYNIILLSILFIYGYVSALLVVKKSYIGKLAYNIILVIVLLIISISMYIFIYVLTNKNIYTQGIDNTNNLYIRYSIEGTDVQNIYSAASEKPALYYKVLATSLVLIFGMAILFFSLKKDTTKIFIRGFASSGAILVVPLLWTINIILAYNYFYIYPLLILFSRFFRYIGMSFAYYKYDTDDIFKERVSEDMASQFENFKNYSPSWCLIGMDIMKYIIGINGYNNSEYSKSVIGDDNNSTNLSNNKYFASGYLSLFISKYILHNNNNTSSKNMWFIAGEWAIILAIVLFLTMNLYYGFF